VAFPSETTSLSELPILSIDFETTGVNAMTDKLFSVGCVSIDKRQIKLGSCYHQMINTEHHLDADNVIIHQLLTNKSLKENLYGLSSRPF
jgi:DNA polymerase-3 subunit epsilon